MLQCKQGARQRDLHWSALVRLSRRTGPVRKTTERIARSGLPAPPPPQQQQQEEEEVVFNERLWILFEKLRIVRMVDANAMRWST